MQQQMTHQDFYIMHSGKRCPCCGSKDISGGEWHFDTGVCKQEVSCNDCPSTWLACFTLTGFTLQSGELPNIVGHQCTSKEKPEIKQKYTVHVCRVDYVHRDINVVASSKTEAKERAISIAGNFSFGEKSTDYLVKKCVVSEGSVNQV